MNNHINEEWRALDETFSLITFSLRFILKNNQITLSPCFTFIPKIGVGLPKTGLVFTVYDTEGGNPYDLRRTGVPSHMIEHFNENVLFFRSEIKQKRGGRLESDPVGFA